MPKRHEWSIEVVPGGYFEDPSKWEVKKMRDKIAEIIDVGPSGFIDIIDTLDYGKRIERLQDRIKELEQDLKEAQDD